MVGDAHQFVVNGGVTGADPLPAPHGAVGWGLDRFVAQRGEVDLDDGESRVVAHGRGVRQIVLSALLVFAGNIQEHGVDAVRLRSLPPQVVALHESAAANVEHTAVGVDLLGEQLRLDERMLTAKTLHLGVNELTIGPALPAHILGVVNEDPANAVLFFRLPRHADLAGEQRLAGPHGAPKDPGGVGRGNHVDQVLVVFLHLDILGFIELEQQVGGLTDDVGLGRR